jgi:hypothetical protein
MGLQNNEQAVNDFRLTVTEYCLLQGSPEHQE